MDAEYIIKASDDLTGSEKERIWEISSGLCIYSGGMKHLLHHGLPFKIAMCLHRGTFVSWVAAMFAEDISVMSFTAQQLRRCGLATNGLQFLIDEKVLDLSDKIFVYTNPMLSVVKKCGFEHVAISRGALPNYLRKESVSVCGTQNSHKFWTGDKLDNEPPVHVGDDLWTKSLYHY